MICPHRRSNISEKAWLPPMRESSAAVCVDGKVYVFGGVGCGGESGRYSEVAVFDKDKDEWAPISASGNAPTQRSRHSATAVGHYFYVYGGTSREAPATCRVELTRLRTIRRELLPAPSWHCFNRRDEAPSHCVRDQPWPSTHAVRAPARLPARCSVTGSVMCFGLIPAPTSGSS